MDIYAAARLLEAAEKDWGKLHPHKGAAPTPSSGSDAMTLYAAGKHTLTPWEYDFFPDVHKKTVAKGVAQSPKQALYYNKILEKLKKAAAQAAPEPEPEPEPDGSTPADPVAAMQAKVKSKFPPSKYQMAIFDWIIAATKKPKAALIVDAKAGSGKTATIEQALNLIPKSQRTVFLAFGKDIAAELEARTKNNPQVLASTTSSLGWAACRKAYPYTKTEILSHYQKLGRSPPTIEDSHGKGPALDDNKVSRIIRRTVAEKDQERWFTPLKDLVGLRKGYYSTDDSGKFDGIGVDEIAAKHNIEIPSGKEGEAFRAALETIWQENLSDTHTMDYADMIFMPVYKSLPLVDKKQGMMALKADWVMVDETQDLTPAETVLIKRVAPRTVVVGDPRQCAPPGSMVAVPGGGKLPIEQLKNGDKVVAFSRESKAIVGRENGFSVEVGVRDYRGDLVRIRAGDAETRTTPNHRWLVRWRNRKADHGTCAVYIMQKGDRFRVGWCQMFTGPDHTFHLTQRARIERADHVWILRAFKSRTDASVYESIVAAKYGLPTITFHPVTGAKHLTAEAIESVFEALQGPMHVERAKDCLEAHGRDLALPLWPPIGKSFAKMGRTTLFETYAANLEPDLMAVPTPALAGSPKEVVYKRVASVKREPYDGPVYSLKVEKHETYIQDGLITHNSIYQFRGADPNSMAKLQTSLSADELPLSISYRCSKAVIAEAQKIVPGIEASPTAKEGSVGRIPYNAIAQHAKPGDMVLCRTNAPLVGECLRMLASNKKAQIVGRDIGKEVTNLVKKIGGGKKYDPEMPIADFYALVQEYGKNEKAKLLAAEKEHLIAPMEDKIATILALSEGATVAEDIAKRITTMFVENPGPGVNFSSAHRSKGLQAENVFIMRPDLMPFPFAKGEEQIKQEMNLKYVAITRAKNNLTWVDPPPKEAKEEIMFLRESKELSKLVEKLTERQKKILRHARSTGMDKTSSGRGAHWNHRSLEGLEKLGLFTRIPGQGQSMMTDWRLTDEGRQAAEMIGEERITTGRSLYDRIVGQALRE